MGDGIERDAVLGGAVLGGTTGRNLLQEALICLGFTELVTKGTNLPGIYSTLTPG